MLPSTDDRGNAVARLFKLLAASVAAGVLAALIVLPGIGSTGITARDAADDFMNMDVVEITREPAERTMVYGADGKVLVTFFDQYREKVAIDKVAPIMRKAIVAIEDSRFYEHGALDLKGTIRALATNTSSGDTVQGGSTLTQQLAKNMLVNNTTTKEGYKEVTAPTVTRKLRELRLALQLEQTMSKDQILGDYLNIAYFGAGAYGIQAAAKRYFNKPAASLSLVQAATLAGITKNPYALDPTLFPDAALERRNTVLDRMSELEIITPDEAAKAKQTPLKLDEYKPRGGCVSSRAPYFCSYVYNEMIKIFMADKKPKNAKERQQMMQDARNELLRGGYTIHTTLDWKVQKAADQAVKYAVKPKGNRVNAEAVVEPGTGQIKAIAVSKKFGENIKQGENTINLAANVEHGNTGGVEGGSTFKTFTMLAALEQGIPIRTSFTSPSRITVTGFSSCKGDGFGPWTVANASDSEAGTFNMRNGTEHSVNTYYAQLEKKVGLCDSVKMAERFGMRQTNGEPLQQVPSQVLGTNSIDLVHLAAAYAGIAARGKYCAPMAVTEVIGPDGKKYKLPENKCDQVIDDQIADAATDILEGVLTRGTAQGLGIGRPAAGKTGTCESYSCAVFAGYTPQLAAAAAHWDYRGGFKHPVTGIYGATIPGPIWQRTMTQALQGVPVVNFKTPTKDFGDVKVKGVPNVKGKSVVEATGILKGAGFDVKISPRPVKSDAPPTTVARTSPSGQAEEGAVITIYISAGNGQFPPGPGDDHNGNQPNGWPFN